MLLCNRLKERCFANIHSSSHLLTRRHILDRADEGGRVRQQADIAAGAAAGAAAAAR